MALRNGAGLRRALLVGAGLQLIQQLSGINTVSEWAIFACGKLAASWWPP